MIVGAEFATNAISYAALSKAATGRVRAIISELIERLMHGTENDFLALGASWLSAPHPEAISSRASYPVCACS
jgi:hypothetical protein